MATDGSASERERLWANVTFPIIVTLLVLAVVGSGHRRGDREPDPPTPNIDTPGSVPTPTLKPPGPVEPCSVCAHVQNTLGTPISGAIVVVNKVDGANETQEGVRTTGTDGTACENVVKGTYRAYVTPPSGYAYAGVTPAPATSGVPYEVSTNGLGTTYTANFVYLQTP